MSYYDGPLRVVAQSLAAATTCRRIDGPGPLSYSEMLTRITLSLRCARQFRLRMPVLQDGTPRLRI